MLLEGGEGERDAFSDFFASGFCAPRAAEKRDFSLF